MSQLLAASAALAAAVCFALSSVCQHHAASHTPQGSGLRLGLLGRLLARPAWLLGSAAGAAGMILQVLALQWGLLIVVQPLLVTGLLFALPAALLIQRRRPSITEWMWASLLAAGLALFLLAAHPHTAAPVRINPGGLIVATITVVALSGIAVLAGARHASRYRAALWGAAAGAGFGLAGSLGKYCLLLLTHGLGHMLASWALWALLAIAVCALVLAQAAFQSGQLSASLPPLTLIDPLVAVCVGLTGLSESLLLSPQALAGETAGALAMTTAVIALARRTQPA